MWGQNVHKVNELLTFRNFYDEKLKMLLTSPNLGTLTLKQCVKTATRVLTAVIRNNQEE